MKIAFLSDTYWPRVNGVATAIDVIADRLRALGHRVVLFTSLYPGQARDEEEAAGPDEVRRYPALRVLVSPEDRVIAPWRYAEVARDLAAFDPDIVHSHTEFGMMCAARRYCESAGKPFVLSLHTCFEEYVSAYFPRLLAPLVRNYARVVTRARANRAAIVLAPSNAMREILEGYGVSVPVRVVPTGIDAGHFAADDDERARSRAEVERAHPRVAGKALLFYAGRVGREKNVDLLADAMARIVARRQAVLAVAGDGPYREGLKHRFVSLGLEDSYLPLGYVERHELRGWYAASDVLVFPSTTETQGLVPIEAMTAGTPVVAVGRMGTLVTMEGGAGGFLTEDDADEFAARTLDLLEDPDLRARKSREARERAREWTDERLVGRLVAAYGEAMEARR